MWEKAMAPHSSTLAWKIPWMEEPGRLQSMGSPLMWVGLTQSVEGLGWTKDWLSQARGSSAAGSLQTQTAPWGAFSWISRLLIHSADFEFASFHYCMNQFLKINLYVFIPPTDSVSLNPDYTTGFGAMLHGYESFSGHCLVISPCDNISDFLEANLLHL